MVGGDPYRGDEVAVARERAARAKATAVIESLLQSTNAEHNAYLRFQRRAQAACAGGAALILASGWWFDDGLSRPWPWILLLLGGVLIGFGTRRWRPRP
jgi:fatty acid desaturase